MCFYHRNTNARNLWTQSFRMGLKPFFCDEFVMNYASSEEWTKIKKIIKLVDFLWIVPSTTDLKYDHYEEWKNEFTILDLSQNFRNSREIVKMTKSIAEERNYGYQQGIVMPPENFPTGCPPILVHSFEDAMKEARKRTKGGILVITDNDCSYKIEDGLRRYYDSNLKLSLSESWEFYLRSHNSFEEKKKEENPYKFLQEGKLLIADEYSSLGFEWTTVILYQKKNNEGETYHDCNYMLRCTTNLIVVCDDDDDDDGDPENDQS